MKWLLLMLVLIMSVGCANPFFAAKRLTPEQLEGMAKIMELNKASGCFNSGVSAAFATASGEVQYAVCFGLAETPILEDYMNMMSGIVLSVRKDKP
jgi:hypothetical protein